MRKIRIYIDGCFFVVDLDKRQVVSGTNHEKYLMFTRSKFMTEMAVTIAEYKEREQWYKNVKDAANTVCT